MLGALLTITINEAEESVAEKNTAIEKLSKELSKKRPIDALRESQVRQWLSDFPDAEKEFLKWLLNNHPAHHGEIVHSGFDLRITGSAIQTGRRLTLFKDIGGPKGWALEINPHYLEALTDALHPY